MSGTSSVGAVGLMGPGPISESPPLASSSQRTASHQVINVEHVPAPAAAVVVRALGVLAMIVQHVLLCTLATWLANFVCSRGNVASSKAIVDQPHAEFVLTVVFWTQLWFCGAVVVLEGLNLGAVHFLQRRERPPSFAYGLWRLLRATYRMFLLVLLLDVAANQLVSVYGTAAWPPLAHWNLEFYIGILLSLGYFTSAVVASRTLYRTQTVEGHAKYPNGSPHADGWRFVFRKLLQCSIGTITVMFATMYVQISSDINRRITDELHLLLFTGGSLVLKFAVQELTKRFMMIRKVQYARTIYVLVGLPTVLIDTQVRLVVQQLGSPTTTYSSIVLMGILELVLRLGKLLLVRFDIARHRRLVRRHQIADRATLKHQRSPRLALAWASPRQSISDLFHLEQLAKLMANANQAERRLLRYHAAESYADMTAEYIAIACSTSIWFFYADHPKYRLTDRVKSWKNGTSSLTGGQYPEARHGPIVSGSALWYLAAPIAMEALVDFLSCVLEIRAGIDFRDVHQHRLFLGVLFVTFVLLNISIAAFVYLNDT